jgi:hypothetical protein
MSISRTAGKAIPASAASNIEEERVYDPTPYFTGGGGGMSGGPEDTTPPLREVQQRGSIRKSKMIYEHRIIIDRDGKRFKEVYAVPRAGYELTYVRFKFPIDALGRVDYQACETDAGVGRRIRKRKTKVKAAAEAEVEAAADEETETEEAIAEIETNGDAS